ncbi:MAG TPA: pyrrolo-quinoline quinone [Planctomycetaceae bacterium]|nr:pyrrolo-quinoline quinone [Planctomycetaceae bacterium]
MSINRRTALGALSVAGAASFLNQTLGAEPSKDWPTWRGPQRDGHATDQWPADLSGLKQLWSKELSESYSGPITSGGKVFTTETVEARDETLIALDAKTGEQIWKKQWAGAMQVPFFAKANGDWIRSTPATDGQHVVVGGMRDVVACFSADSGDELWRVDFAAQGKTLPNFGLVCSPLIDGDHVYIQAGGGIRKIELATGKTTWIARQEPGGMMGGAFSSPTIATLHDKRQLVCQTRSHMCGIDLETGAEIWNKEIAAFRGMNILTPTVWNDQVFTSAYRGKSQLVKVEPSGSQWQTSLAWEGSSEAYMSSPVVVGSHAYVHLRNKRLACVDLETGKETWRTRPFGEYWSMITNGKKVLALDSGGELVLFEANPGEYTELGRRKISDQPTWAHVALADDMVYVRRLKGLDCYKWS